MSAYRLASLSGIPYMTVNDLVNEVTPISHARFSTIIALSQALGISCDDLVDDSPYCLPSDRDLFASSLQHELKRQGDLDFISSVYSERRIDSYLKNGCIFEARYLLALIDYLSRINKLPLAKDFRAFRAFRFQDPVFLSYVSSEKEKEEWYHDAIPEFLVANIIEGDSRNVA